MEPEGRKRKPMSVKSADAASAKTPHLSKAETKSMEVHHHPEVEKKGFKEYLLEGLMIFLAVTMGFFAETIRESISESSHAKELAESLFKEAYTDSVTMQARIKLRLEKESQMQYFRQYVSDSSLTRLSPRFYPAFEWTYVLTSSNMFEPNDGILNQLRNSGSLRYLKGNEVQNRISQMNVVTAVIRERNRQELEFLNNYIRPFMLKHFDFKWQDEYVHYGKITILEALTQTDFRPSRPPVIKHLDQFDRQDAEGLTAYYLLVTRATRQVFYQNYINANRQLLAALRNEYHFKNE